MEHARPAGAEDLTGIATLWRMAVAELDGERGGQLLAASLFREDLDGQLRAYLEDPMSLLVVGFIDDVAVGFAIAVCDRSLRDAVAKVELIYVDPNARTVGVGEAMVDLILPWARSLGCVGVDAPALPGNRPAKAFFEDNGFLARLLVMHRRLMPESEAE